MVFTLKEACSTQREGVCLLQNFSPSNGCNANVMAGVDQHLGQLGGICMMRMTEEQNRRNQSP